MEFPNDLMIKLEGLLDEEVNFNELDKNAKEISKRYRSNSNTGKRLVTQKNEAIAYALSRMPATYAAVYDALQKTLELNDINIDSVLDIGAGTGAATWAIYNKIKCDTFYCYEREQSMRAIGKQLMKGTDLEDANWKEFDIIENNIEKKCDLVVASYMLNEISMDKIDKALEKMWNATNKILLILEPGTPKGFEIIKYIRSYLLQKKANIIAPCSHGEKCEIQENDWCQFACRVQRSKIHKILKNGQAPYEDEKFSYIAFSKTKVNMADNRILRHPIINKGYTEFKICNKDGIKTIKISKKDGALYKESRKKSAGDSIKI